MRIPLAFRQASIVLISIHATLTGSDHRNAEITGSRRCFYSRHPYGQRQRKDGVAFSVGPENFLFVQVDAEFAVFEGGHGIAHFVMEFGLVFCTTFIMSILYHAVMILAIYYAYTTNASLDYARHSTNT